VAAGEGVALVRLAGQWHASPEQLVPDVRLVMLIGGVPVAIPRVPEPVESQTVAAPAGSPWRAAFRVSAEVIGQTGIDFRLEAGGLAIELPHPSEMGRAAPAAARERAPDPTPAPAPEPATPVERAPDTDLPPSGDLRDALEQIRELEARLHELEARLREHEELVASSEQRATRAEVEFVQTRAEVEQAWAQAAELQNVAETVEERARRSDAERDTLAAAERELRAELDNARARLERIESQPAMVTPPQDDQRLEHLGAELQARSAAEEDLRQQLASTQSQLEEARTAAGHERNALDAESQALEAELLRINQADAEREALEAEVEALRRQIEDGGPAGSDRLGMLEEEIERRVTAEHELRAQLETQDAELGAARAAADSRARELQDAEHRIAQAIKSRSATATVEAGQPPPQFDDEVMGRIAAAKEAAALVGE